MAAPIVPDLLELMSDTIEVKADTGHDFKGNPNPPGATQVIRCRIQGRARQVRDVTGAVRVSTIQATLGGFYNVSVLDHYTLPDRFNPRTPPAIAVEKHTDENGPHHEVVFF